MGKKKNADVYRELNAVSLLNYLKNYRHNWTVHLRRYKKVQNSRTDGKLLINTKKAGMTVENKRKITGLMEKDPWEDLIKYGLRP